MFGFGISIRVLIDAHGEDFFWSSVFIRSGEQTTSVLCSDIRMLTSGSNLDYGRTLHT